MTTATLEAEIEEYMDAEDDGRPWTNCEECREAVLNEYADEHDDLCPRCHHAALAAEAKEEAVDAAQSELDEADSDLEGLADEMKELKERIAEAKGRRKRALAALARLAG